MGWIMRLELNCPVPHIGNQLNGETPQPRREYNALWNVLKRELKE